MADFLPAYIRVVAGSEGGYVDDPSDSGGETYAGITRRDWPAWSGWAFIDSMRPVRRGTVFRHLEEPVREFYREHYWNAVRGDAIRSQPIADEMLDVAVNCGPGVAITFMQRVLNAMNLRGALWPNITVDGGIGPATLAALQGLEQRWNDVLVFVKLFNALQGARYIELCEHREKDERFVRGWASRV